MPPPWFPCTYAGRVLGCKASDSSQGSYHGFMTSPWSPYRQGLVHAMSGKPVKAETIIFFGFILFSFIILFNFNFLIVLNKLFSIFK